MALIYIVEDDENIREIEMIALKNGNYDVEAFESAKDFYVALNNKVPSLVLLDVMLEGEDGFEIVKKLRTNLKYKSIPIVMVTAKTQEMDMIKGLDLGADDYIKKPFSVIELLSRVKAILRRSEKDTGEIITVGLIELNDSKRTVTVDKKPVELTFKEFELLKYLMQNQGIVLSRDKIMNKVWNTEYEIESRTLDIHIKTLRKKLLEASNQIITVRNVGYSLNNTNNEKEN